MERNDSAADGEGAGAARQPGQTSMSRARWTWAVAIVILLGVVAVAAWLALAEPSKEEPHTATPTADSGARPPKSEGHPAPPVVDPDARMARERAKSRDNVKELVKLHLERALAGRQPPVGGKAFVLWPVALGMVDPDWSGATDVFFSPADRGARERATREEFLALTRDRLKQGADVRHLTSYVGRRLDPGDRARVTAGEVLPWIADLHFPDGAIVGFADGKVEWMTRAQLGLAPDDPIVAGPESKSPLLRQLSE